MTIDIAEFQPPEIEVTQQEPISVQVVQSEPIYIEVQSIGIQGPMGATGPTGPPVSMAIDNVVTLNTGEPATASLLLQGGIQKLSLGLPRGLQGEQGPVGPPGAGNITTINGSPGPDIALDKTWVGLNLVDNTPDSAKPVSTAQQTALNGKANLSHTHAISEIVSLQTMLDAKADGVHSHAITDVTGLQSALDSKADTIHTHTSVSITNFDAAVDARINNWVGAAPALMNTLDELSNALGDNPNFATDVAASIADKENSIAVGTTTQYFRGDKTWRTLDKAAVGLENVDNTSDALKPVSAAMQTALNFKANATAVVGLTGNQTIAGIKTFSSAPVVPDASFAIAKTTGLQTALDGKAPTAHLHAQTDIIGLINTLDNKANTTHTHAVGDVNGLQTLLDAKADINHNHTIANVTNLQTTLDGKAAAVHTHTIANVTGLQTALDAKAGLTAPTFIGLVTAGSFAGSGAALTALDAGNISAGTLAQARLVPNVVRVLHGSVATTARPTGATYVEWVGTVQPTNAASGDTWVKTT